MTAEFSINKWFNSHPIRIIGSPEEPFFYASDLAAVLGIKNIRPSLNSLSEIDIVSAAQRRKYNINTYKIHRGKTCLDQSIILLTETGAYSLIYKSRSQIAGPFRAFISELIRTDRRNDRLALESIDQDNVAELGSTATELSNELNTYRSKVPTLYLFKRRIDGDPYDFIPKGEIDEYARDMAYKHGPPEIVKNLYKLTDKPTAVDKTMSTLYAKILDPTKEALHSLPSDDMVSITEEAHKHNVYFTRKPPIEDLEGVSIEYC